jgi:hypothetical protein
MFITIRKKKIHNNNNNNNNKGLYTKEKNIRFEINNIVIIRDNKFITLICGSNQESWKWNVTAPLIAQNQTDGNNNKLDGFNYSH